LDNTVLINEPRPNWVRREAPPTNGLFMGEVKRDRSPSSCLTD
jgi:hypothetical protein